MIDEDHEGHGHSTAAWTAVAVMLVGAALACWAVAIANVGLTFVGGAIFLIGAVLWPLLSKMGYGDKEKPRSLYSD